MKPLFLLLPALLLSGCASYVCKIDKHQGAALPIHWKNVEVVVSLPTDPPLATVKGFTLCSFPDPTLCLWRTAAGDLGGNVLFFRHGRNAFFGTVEYKVFRLEHNGIIP